MQAKKHRDAAPAVRCNTPLMFLMLALVPLHGGYETGTVLLSGALLALLLLADALREQRLLLPWGREGVLLCGLTLSGLLNAPFAVSPGAALSGGLRMAVWLLFFSFALTYTQEEKELMLDALAWEGAVLSLVSSAVFLVRQASDGGDLNGRLDGFFQYANTWALYLLACLILLMLRPHRTGWDLAGGLALTAGILLTGSRGVILLLFLLVLAGTAGLIFREKKLKPALLGLLALAAVCLGVEWLSGGMLLRRLAAVSLSSSSLNGRLLYWLDGIKMLADHPLGVGRGGWLYLQPLYQTGDYVVRFIHNGYLQAALDGGLAAGVCMLLLPISMLLRKTIPLRQRLVILVIALHGLIDFDFEFSSVSFLMLLCASEPERTHTVSLSLPVRRKGVLAAGSLLAGLMLCLSLPYCLSSAGNSDAAGKLWPGDLELREDRLLALPSMEEAEREADRILERTDLSMVAWDCKRIACERRGDYGEAVRAGLYHLRLNPYREKAYRDFAQLLRTAAGQADEAERAELAALGAQAAAQLRQVMGRTSPLALRTADRPDWSFSGEILAELAEIEQVPA